MALQGKAFASKPEDLSSTPRTHTLEGENSLQKLSLTPQVKNCVVYYF